MGGEELLLFHNPSRLSAADLDLESSKKKPSRWPAGLSCLDIPYIYFLVNLALPSLLSASVYTALLTWATLLPLGLANTGWSWSLKCNAIYSKNPPPRLGQVLVQCLSWYSMSSITVYLAHFRKLALRATTSIVGQVLPCNGAPILYSMWNMSPEVVPCMLCVAVHICPDCLFYYMSSPLDGNSRNSWTVSPCSWFYSQHLAQLLVTMWT